MGSLIGLVKPLWPLIVLAVLFGTAGYLCAIFLTIITGNILARGIAFSHLTWLLLAMAVMRGVLHYAEQYFNHFIAFKLLAIIRHDIFAALRRLCPAKLEGRDKEISFLLSLPTLSFRGVLCTYNLSDCDCHTHRRNYGWLYWFVSSNRRSFCTGSLYYNWYFYSSMEWQKKRRYRYGISK